MKNKNFQRHGTKASFQITGGARGLFSWYQHRVVEREGVARAHHPQATSAVRSSGGVCTCGAGAKQSFPVSPRVRGRLALPQERAAGTAQPGSSYNFFCLSTSSCLYNRGVRACSGVGEGALVVQVNLPCLGRSKRT